MHTLTATSGSSNATFTVTGVAGPARKVAFASQPSSAAIGVAISPAVSVRILDSLGNLVASATNNVTLSLSSNPGGATVGGTLTVAAIGGVATFDNVSLNAAGNGYALLASSASLASVISGPFNVIGAPAKLAFIDQPSGGFSGGILDTVVVAVQDINGGLVTSSSAIISLAIGANPGSATLGGTVAAPAASGLVTFTNLTISAAGAGYTLTASSSAVTGATSTTFSVGTSLVATVTVTPGDTSATTATKQFTATVRDSSANTIAGKTVTWSSLNPNVATINAAGLATPLASGQATIAATVDGRVGYALLTVARPATAAVNSWSAMTSGTAGWLFRSWSYSTTDVYAVGIGGQIRRFNGAAWSAMTSSTSNDLYDVWGTSPTNIFAVGLNGTIVRFDGVNWTTMSSGTTANLFGVWGTSPNNVFAVGAGGTPTDCERSPRPLRTSGCACTSRTSPASASKGH